MIIASKRQEWKAKNLGVVTTEVEKEEVESDKTENPPEPTHEELRRYLGLQTSKFTTTIETMSHILVSDK